MTSMPSPCPTNEPPSHRGFLLLHGLVLPLCSVALAVWLQGSGWDMRLSAAFYDAGTRHFLAGGDGWVELLGHRLTKLVVTGAWLMLLAAALAAPWVPALTRYRRVLWTTTLAMGLGPGVVTLLKDINTHVCPWSLTQFGGTATYSADWFVSRSNAGRCFPGGHASGGFSLIALAFAGRALGWAWLQRAGWMLALAAGSLFSVVRMTQGAHFMSHNLWAAAIDWWAAAVVFLPLLARRATVAATAPVAATEATA